MDVICPGCCSSRQALPCLKARDAVLVKCPDCGLVRVDPWPAEEQVLPLYGLSYFRGPTRGYLDYAADEPVFAREMGRRLTALEGVGCGGRGTRLLDVGCASGVLLRIAAGRGYRVTGLEADLEVARWASERSGLVVQAGSVTQALLGAASKDLITLFDVLEHLVEPLDVLRRLRQAVMPSGAVAITAPDFGGWWSRLTGRRWPFVTPWEHLTFFTRRSLAGLLERAGYGDVQFLHARTPCSWHTLAQRLRLPTSLARRVSGRGLALPFGTLFAVARP